MIERIRFIVLVFFTGLLLVAGSTIAFASNLAVPIKSTVIVDGESVSFDAYNINGESYFKLRELAYSFRNSQKRFSVGYDAAHDAIKLTSGEEYLPVGGEMGKKSSGNKVPNTISTKIFIDGHQRYLNSYNIEGNTFFKLRDIATVFDIGLGWDGSKNTITLSTDKNYTTPNASGSVPYLNTYYLMVVGMTVDEADARYGKGKQNPDITTVMDYPQGFFVAPMLNGESTLSGEAICSGMGGKMSLLIGNCPQTVRFSDLKRIFGTASIRYEEIEDTDDMYCVVVPYAGYTITMNSDSNGNVDSSTWFNYNPANGQYSSVNSPYNYEGVWAEGVVGNFSSERNYTELVLRNISDKSLNFDLNVNRGIVSSADNITATSTDGVVYKATFRDEGWEVDGCTVKITLKNDRVFIEGEVAIASLNLELFKK